MTLLANFLENFIELFMILGELQENFVIIFLLIVIIVLEKSIELTKRAEVAYHQVALCLIELLFFTEIFAKVIPIKLIQSSLNLIRLKSVLLIIIIQVINRVFAQNDNFSHVLILLYPFF
jgi:hypothetical protein